MNFHSNSNILLIGYGSIGKRHSKNLFELGFDHYILTQYPDHSDAFFIDDIGVLKNRIDYCIIASPTSMHLDALKNCLKLKNIPTNILIEKPIELSTLKGDLIKNLANSNGINISVGYNLRFLKAFDFIKEFIDENYSAIKIVEVIAGQDLRKWRPQTDYKTSYSAFRRLGGGVDLDLSHEIDYILWLFGSDFYEKIILRKKISALEIDSPDIFKLIIDYETFIVDLTLDYIRNPNERYIKIVCDNGKNLEYNLILNILKIGNKYIELRDTIDESYKSLLKSFLKINDNENNKLCSLDDGLVVLKTLGL